MKRNGRAFFLEPRIIREDEKIDPLTGSDKSKPDLKMPSGYKTVIESFNDSEESSGELDEEFPKPSFVFD
jgi:hypothetical protein